MKKITCWNFTGIIPLCVLKIVYFVSCHVVFFQLIKDTQINENGYNSPANNYFYLKESHIMDMCAL